VLSFRVRRRKPLHLLGNLETGKSKREFCAPLRFRSEESRCWDKKGQIGTDWERLGENGTTSDKRKVGNSWRQKTTRGYKSQQKATVSDNWRQESQRRAARVEVVRLVLEHKGMWRTFGGFWRQVSHDEGATLWRFLASCATNAPQPKVRGSNMRKHRIERNLAFPTEEFRRQIRSAARERGFRSEQAFILAACENELKRGDST